MGQFKQMVKMMTTEPTVELKLKKGGKVSKMADGGFAPMQSGMPSSMPARGGMMPAASPMKPSMAARRKAMMVSKPPMPMPPAMKKGGKAEGGKADMAQDKAMIKKAFKEHDMQEHKGGKGTKLKLKTGGVTEGQGGYATGGAIASEKVSGNPKKTIMDTSKPDSAKGTGKVTNGNKAGFKTGGVALSNAGGFKKGGSAKKAYAAGGTVDSGKPVAMPQGRKPAPKPVSINQLSGTYKKGGNVKKMADGGDLSKGAYDASRALEKADNEAMRETILGAPKRAYEGIKSLFSPKPAGSVTKTKESVTVAPAGKKRGGKVC
jgi:hypothetical protein